MKQTHMSYLMSLFLRIKVFLLLSSVTDSRGPCNLCVLSCLLFLSLNLPSYTGIKMPDFFFFSCFTLFTYKLLRLSEL